MTAETAVPQEITSQEKPKIEGRWKSGFSLSFASFLDNNEGTSFITAMFPIIREQLGMSLGTLGWMAALPKILAVIFGPFWASVGRKYNRKNVLIFATGIWGLWAIAIGLSQSVTQLFLFVIISLIGAVASQPLMQEMLMDLFGDEERGKAVSLVFGASAIVIIPMFAVNAWLATMDNGWRIGFYAAGILSALSGLIIWRFLNDPGRGASESELAEVEQVRKEEYGLVNWEEVKELFQIKTFVLMLGQRVLSGHLLMLSFGVVYMVDVLGLDTPQANLMMIPLMVGVISGMFAFGFIGDWIHKKSPQYGRIGAIQFIQFVYAIMAFFGTQFLYDNVAIYGVLFFSMGFFGSANMGVNRPIVASVVRPELRGTAFALFVSVFEAIAWAIYNVVAGQLGEIYGLKPVFLAVLVILMLVNTAFITLLYKPYAKDVQALKDSLATRRDNYVNANLAS
ncbi:MFS transporter [Candidatus Leptofilum sp.]|uniref:MFS transporter n=1 Tax=Candidatus Leptofilum sp. TaxID=3241576 RepID=UPI003B5947B8